MHKVVLIDGNSLANRAFYALPNLATVDGVPTNALVGFLNIFFKLLEEEKPYALGVAFDRAAPTFRHQAYAEYKAHRTGTPEELAAQLPLLKDILTLFGVPIYEKEGFEADDLLGTMARQAEEQGLEIIIVTGDRDALQLVSSKTRVMLTKKGISEIALFDPETVQAVYGLTPAQLIDVKGLMGDPSDNIPGVPGIGEKTALKLISQFHSVEEALARRGEVKEKRIAEALERYGEQALMSKRLATIDRQAPIQLVLEPYSLDRADWPKIFEVFRRLELKALMKRAQDWVARRGGLPETAPPGQGVKESGEEGQNLEEVAHLGRDRAVAPGEPTGDILIHSLATPAEVLAVFAGKTAVAGGKAAPIVTVSPEVSSENKPVGIAAGTLSLLPVAGERNQLVQGLFMAWTEGIWEREPVGRTPAPDQVRGAVEKPAPETAGEAQIGPRVYYLELSDEMVEALAPLWSQPDWSKLGHDLKPLATRLARRGLELAGLAFDTSLAAYLLDPSRSNYPLEALFREYLKMDPSSGAETEPGGPGHAVDTPLTVTRSRFGRLAWSLPALCRVLDEELKKNDLAPLFYQVEMPLLKVLAEMEATGVAVNPSLIQEMSQDFGRRLAAKAEEIYHLAGGEFNINSTRQLGEVLFEKLGLPAGKKTKTGYSTSAEVLESLLGSHPIIEKILEYRTLAKLKSTYLDGILPLLDPVTGRIHSTFNQTITATGRISSTEPNLQNIPIRMEVGRLIRRIFVAPPGHLLLAADYSQIELRVLAHLSGDPYLIESFLLDQDVHARTAAEVFGVPLDQVTTEQRTRAKAVNFGIVYGISDFGLARDIGVSRSQAKQYIDSYFARYAGVKNYLERTVAEAREKGYVTTLMKRRRYLPDINSRNRTLRQFAERTAMNTPIQGSAADIIKLAMVNVHRELKRRRLRTRLILQVHDELIFEVPEEELEEVKTLVQQGMEKVLSLRVPLKVDLKVGPNWLEMKKV